MEYIGIDVHLGESQISILTEQGEILERRIRTQRERHWPSRSRSCWRGWP